jgi:hypothetical protein
MSQSTPHERRPNHYGECRSALRGLFAAFIGDREKDPAYRAARHYLRTTCSSCGETIAENRNLCPDCRRRFDTKPGPLRPVA